MKLICSLDNRRTSASLTIEVIDYVKHNNSLDLEGHGCVVGFLVRFGYAATKNDSLNNWLTCIDRVAVGRMVCLAGFPYYQWLWS